MDKETKSASPVKKSKHGLHSYDSDEGGVQLGRFLNKLEILLSNPQLFEPDAYPSRTDINNLVIELDAVEEQAELLSHQIGLDNKVLDKLVVKVPPKRNTANPNRLVDKLPTQSIVSRKGSAHFPVVKDSFNLDKKASANINRNSSSRPRRSSKSVPAQQAPEIVKPTRSLRKNGSGQVADKKPPGSRSRARNSLTGLSPHSGSVVDSVVGSENVKLENKLLSVKRSDISPHTGTQTPSSADLKGVDPDQPSNLLLVAQSEPSFVPNATKFQDNRKRMVVNEDFSKAKGTYTVPIQTFQNYADPYLRDIHESDLKYIAPIELDSKYFEIPPLGRHYKTGRNCVEPIANPKLKVNGSATVEKEPGPSGFTERLLATLLPSLSSEAQVDSPDLDFGDTINDTAQLESSIPLGKLQDLVTNTSIESQSVEARIRRELASLDPTFHTPDANVVYDEVSLQLLRLQNQLREQNAFNNLKRVRVTKLARDFMAYQEYVAIVDAKDNELETAYAKRQNLSKHRRKKQATASSSKTVPETVDATLESRNRIIKGFNALFDPAKVLLPSDAAIQGIIPPPTINPDSFPNKEV